MAENGNVGKFLSQDYAGLPGWVWLAIVGAGIGVAYIVPKFFGGATSSTSGQTATDQGTANSGTSGLGLAVDPTTGLPYAVEGLSPSGGVSGGGGASAGGIDLSSTNNLLQQILSNLGQTMPTPSPTPTPVSTPHPTPTPSTLPHPVLPQGTRVPAQAGSFFSFNGQNYTIVPGPGGRIWGVLGHVSLQQAQQTPIGSQKVLLMAPASYYGGSTSSSPTSPTPRYTTVARWPNQSSTLSDIASRAGISQQRLLQLNPQIKNPSSIQPGQQVRIA